MPQLEPIDNSQTEGNAMSRVAEAERAKLFPKNEYNTGNQYSQTNPNAMADGDERGRGTGGDLDVLNADAGTLTDRIERINEIKINKFNSSKPYPDF